MGDRAAVILHESESDVEMMTPQFELIHSTDLPTGLNGLTPWNLTWIASKDAATLRLIVSDPFGTVVHKHTIRCRVPKLFQTLAGSEALALRVLEGNDGTEENAAAGPGSKATTFGSGLTPRERRRPGRGDD
jgi:hypothetical protein